MPTHQFGGSTLLITGVWALTIVIRSIIRIAERVISFSPVKVDLIKNAKIKKAAPFQKQLFNKIQIAKVKVN